MKTWITYKRKKINDLKWIDPIIYGLVCNLPYSNPLNDKEFLAYFEDGKQVIFSTDFDIELVDDVSAILDSWYKDVVFDNDEIVDNRQLEI